MLATVALPSNFACLSVFLIVSQCSSILLASHTLYKWSAPLSPSTSMVVRNANNPFLCSSRSIILKKGTFSFLACAFTCISWASTTRYFRIGATILFVSIEQSSNIPAISSRSLFPSLMVSYCCNQVFFLCCQCSSDLRSALMCGFRAALSQKSGCDGSKLKLAFSRGSSASFLNCSFNHSGSSNLGSYSGYPHSFICSLVYVVPGSGVGGTNAGMAPSFGLSSCSCVPPLLATALSCCFGQKGSAA
mmetsp:Transcript_136029/g.290822  ORF Transcript_136029/g.290822 Transcript_136029/m.290822 type:complete len:247 (+) Transcript_136029:1532-2272(+)